MASETRRTFEKLVAEWEGSGQTQAEFCRERGVSLTAFRQWRYVGLRRRTSAAPSLVEVVLPSSTESDAFEVVLRNGLVLRVPPRFDAPALKLLVHALES